MPKIYDGYIVREMTAEEIAAFQTEQAALEAAERSRPLTV